MMEKDKIEQFMVYGIEKKVSIKEVIRKEMVFLFISLILIFAESQGLGLGFFMILILLPTFFYPISCIVIVIKKVKQSKELHIFFIMAFIQHVFLSFGQ